MREIKPFRTVLGVYKKLAITTVSNHIHILRFLYFLPFSTFSEPFIMILNLPLQRTM